MALARGSTTTGPDRLRSSSSSQRVSLQFIDLGDAAIQSIYGDEARRRLSVCCKSSSDRPTSKFRGAVLMRVDGAERVRDVVRRMLSHDDDRAADPQVICLR